MAKSPPGVVLKANWDTGLKVDNGRCGVRVIVRDSKGLVSAALSRTLEVCPDPSVAEAMGNLIAVEFCRD